MTRAVLLGPVLCAVLAGCGGQGNPARDGDRASNAGREEVRRGGTITVLTTPLIDSIDPGTAYQPASWSIAYALHRPLYSAPPGTTEPVPDLAAGTPEIAEGGRRVTVRLRRGVRFSPPFDREVQSGDVRYAMERALTPQVANAYAGTYFGELVGAKRFASGKDDHVEGIETPDRRTLVFRLERPVAHMFVQSLALPATAPVPRSVGRPLDRRSPSEYGAEQVTTGPYMIDRYVPRSRLRLVRNPNWDGPRTGDYRPAFADVLDLRLVGGDGTRAARRVLAGQELAGLGLNFPGGMLREHVERRSPQVVRTPTGAFISIALNSSLPPFDDHRVRLAVAAGLDREALRQALGGDVAGSLASHHLPPGIPGHEEAGGRRAALPELARANGDRQLAARRLQEAGYSGGRYTGSELVRVVGKRDVEGGRYERLLARQLRALGFRVRLELVSTDEEFRRCGTPAERVHVCTLTWLRDFADPVSVLTLPFRGDRIAKSVNFNYGQLRHSRIDAAMREAEMVAEPRARARAWGAIDRDVTAQATSVPIAWSVYNSVVSRDVSGGQGTFAVSLDLTSTGLRR